MKRKQGGTFPNQAADRISTSVHLGGAMVVPVKVETSLYAVWANGWVL